MIYFKDNNDSMELFQREMGLLLIINLMRAIKSKCSFWSKRIYEYYVTEGVWQKIEVKRKNVVLVNIKKR